MRIALPPSPESIEALKHWDSGGREEATGLMLRFAKMHYAINAQKESADVATLKMSLTLWEDDMLNTYLDLTQTIVPKMQDGYGGARTVSDYYTAVNEMLHHAENYRALRSMLNEFLDSCAVPRT